jgi:O-methyltransferase
MIDLAAWEAAGLFARRPQPILGPVRCYHTMNIPSRGVIDDFWDLRVGLDGYLGRVDYTGCTVLEIGPASGLITFTMEQRGATVVAVDLPVAGQCDLLPASASAVADMRRSEASDRQAIRNAFWTAHEAFDSHARLIETNVDELGPDVTGFDVGIICNVLQHRRIRSACSSILRTAPGRLW